MGDAIFTKKYPKLVDAMEQRVNHYNADLELCEQLEEEGKAFIFRPRIH